MIYNKAMFYAAQFSIVYRFIQSDQRMNFLFCLLHITICRKHRTVKELIRDASYMLEMNAAREAAAAYSNMMLGYGAGTNEDIGNFDAADCHCFPCEGSKEDLEGPEMTTLAEKMKSQQVQLARLTNVASQISENQKKKEQKGNHEGGKDKGKKGSSDLDDEDLDEDEDMEDENSMRPMRRHHRRHYH